MSDFFEIFNPGLRHQRQQLDTEKMLVVTDAQGGSGPQPLDLDSGEVVLQLPRQTPSYAEPMETPPAPEPDLRDWTFVLAQPCPECGFVAAEIDPARLPDLVLAGTAAWTAVLAGSSTSQRPAPRVWSPLEYACHVRDLLAVFTERVELIRTQDDPRFPNWDGDAVAIAERYGEQDPARVTAELQTTAADNAAAWAGVGDDEWQRSGTRGDGVPFTLDSLGRYQLHELRHHLFDVGVRPASVT